MLRSKPMEFEQFIGIPVAATLSIEIAQYVLMNGRSDVDDLILNVLGSILGFALWSFLGDWISMHRLNLHCKIFLMTLFISICLLLFKYDGMTRADLADGGRDAIGVTVRIPEYTGTMIQGNTSHLIVKTDADQGSILVKISINELTKIYLEKAADQGRSKSSLKKITMNQLKQFDQNTIIRVWGKQLSERLLAEVIIVQFNSEN
ncbi:VanZ family protein [Sporolactobacillus shoreicorticis]|nr:VanZ family protein [Sporolactobacillus shoreicorticis]